MLVLLANQFITQQEQNSAVVLCIATDCQQCALEEELVMCHRGEGLVEK